MFRLGLKRLLVESEFDIVGEAADVHEALAAAGDLPQPELVVLDARPDTLADDLALLRQGLPEGRIVVLTASMSPDCLSTAFAAGAAGYLLKDVSFDVLTESLKLVLLGEKVFPRDLASMIVNGFGNRPARRSSAGNLPELSEREWEILQCLVEGNSNKVIARRLAITESTVKVHLKSILRKIHVNNRTQAAIWALNNGVGPTDLAQQGTASAPPSHPRMTV